MTRTNANRAEQRRRCTAYHEAGHAVAAFVLGLKIKQVSIEPDSDSLGHVLLGGSKVRDWNRLSPSLRDHLERAITCAFAGPEAERVFAGRYDRLGANGDRDHVRVLVGDLMGTPEATNAFLRWLRISAQDLVQLPNNQIYIKGVAEALLDKGALTNRSVNAAIQRTRRQHLAGFRSVARLVNDESGGR